MGNEHHHEHQGECCCHEHHHEHHHEHGLRRQLWLIAETVGLLIFAGLSRPLSHHRSRHVEGGC